MDREAGRGVEDTGQGDPGEADLPRPPSSVRAGHLVFTSGVIGRSADGDIGAATRQALAEARDRLEAGGSSMEQAVKCADFLVDMDDCPGMNAACVEFFPGSPPARTAVAVLALPAEARVEVECEGMVP